MSVRARASVLWVLLCCLPLFSCKKEERAQVSEKSRPVKVSEVKLEKRPARLEYIGNTSARTIRKLSFKMGGKILEIRVEKGDRVKKGQVIAKLDTQDLRFALRASALSLQKAREASLDADNFYSKIDALYKENARPALDHDRARLNREVSDMTLQQAQVDVNHKRSMISDSTLVADLDGYVVDVLNKPGEMIGAGYPVVLVRTDQQLISVGVTQKDVRRLEPGMLADVTIDEVSGEGTIFTIAQIPDQQSRTYTVELEMTGALASDAFYIGSIAKVAFRVGDEVGVWIPIHAILTDGVPYVYTVEEGRAVRKNLTVQGTSGLFVKVDGLTDGTSLIVEGMKNLKEGYKVEVR